ncbi:hypothetical protein M080_4515, partial [Bacteroides fragilis str. 3397 T10]
LISSSSFFLIKYLFFFAQLNSTKATTRQHSAGPLPEVICK